jgi:hypothetical protein
MNSEGDAVGSAWTGKVSEIAAGQIRMWGYAG